MLKDTTKTNIFYAYSKFLLTPAADHMPLDHMSECKELSCLPLLLDVWSNRAEVLAWKPKTLTAVGTIASKVSQLYNYITSVEEAILHAVGTPNRIISELLMAEQVVCSTKFTDLLKGLLTNVGLLADVSVRQATVPELDFSKFWGDGGENTEGILAVVNSSPAAKLRECWSPLINERNTVTFVIGELNVPKFPFVRELIKAVNDAMDIATIDKNYEKTKDKVCEICVAKAFARPLNKKKGETREQVVNQALETARKLEGNLPPKISMLVSKIVGANEQK